MLGLLKPVSFALLTTLMLLPAPAPSRAQEAKTLPSSQLQLQLSFAPLVKHTSDAVVNVYAERLVHRTSIFDGDPFFQQFFGQQIPNRDEKQYALGSGVIVRADGFIVTNNHVVEGADDIKVALADGREYPCRLVLKDERVDLAVLKIEGPEAFPALPVGDSDKVEVGDLVLAIGNPFGVGQTVTSGIVSAVARNKVVDSEFGFYIQTDASINPGNSGGGLINMKGELIGINTAIFSKGGGSNGVGFAIPANLVRAFLAAAERGTGHFDRPYVGATFDAVTSEIAEALGLHKARGALVVKVLDDGPAAAAGLRSGEIITAVNDIAVEHPDALGYRLATAGIGSQAKLSVLDKGTERTVMLPLEPAPEVPPREQRVVDGRNPLTGAVVANLSPRVAEELQLPTDKKGVVLMEVKQGTLAADLGFAPRDIILSVNGMVSASTKTLMAALKEQSGVWSLDIERKGERMRQVFR